jgi:hypothetical protein
MLIILNSSIILNKVRKIPAYLSLKKLGKNPAFEGYKSPNLVYRGKNCPVK